MFAFDSRSQHRVVKTDRKANKPRQGESSLAHCFGNDLTFR